MHHETNSRFSDSRGFALPAAIFGLLVVALLVVAGFYLANQEQRIGQSSERTAEALRVAEAGISEVIAFWRPADADLDPWVTATGCEECQGAMGNGEWTVSITQVDDNLYLLESTGEVTRGGRLAGATRTISQLARGGVLNLVEPNAAVTTQDQLELQGNATVDGRDSNGDGAGWFMNSGDACPPASGGRPAVLMNEGADYSQGGNAETLAPPGVESPLFDDDLSNESLSVFSPEIWDGLTSIATITIDQADNQRIRPSLDSEGRCNRADPFNWGAPKELSGGSSASAVACQNYFPVTHISLNPGETFEIQANSTGQGILLVDGNLTLRGDFDWAGPIYVRGRFENRGGTGVYGGVVSLGGEIQTNQDEQSISGNAEVTYSSCAITRAVTGASGMLPLRPVGERGWVDLTVASN